MTTDLQEAFREAARREFAMVPDERELDYTFSPGFQRKMQRIIRAQVHGYWNMVNTLGKRIAIAAAIIMMLLTTAMAIKPIRERVINFFVEIYEEHLEITFGKREKGDLLASSQPMARYTLSWVPDGYYEAEVYEFDALLNTIWKIDGGQDISLYQGEGIQRITFDYSNNNLVEFMHGDFVISRLVLDKINTFIWEQHGYIFQLSISDDIPIDAVLRMIDSLQKE